MTPTSCAASASSMAAASSSRSAGVMVLYSAARVSTIERTPAWVSVRKVSMRRACLPANGCSQGPLVPSDRPSHKSAMPPGRRPEAVRRAATFLASDDGPARGSRVLVAVSGGPDSTALASVLAELASDYALALVLGHVAHGLRSPDDEEADAAAVRALGARLGLPVLTRSVDLPAGGDL